MQISNSSNNVVIRFLISPRLKVLRHLALCLIILSMFAWPVWFEDEQISSATTTLNKFSALFLSAFIFIVFIYFNVYVITPRLLLKKRLGLYFLSLLGLVLCYNVLLTFILLTFFYQEDSSIIVIPEGFIDSLAGVINMLSNFMIFFLLFAGTSTLDLFKHWVRDIQQSEELKIATLQMELKLLESQINPHFLFNIINSANIKIDKEPDVAIHIIGKLEEMLGYLMNESVREKVTLTEEMSFLNDYLELEKMRRSRFSYTVTKGGKINDIQVLPMLFITFVENAVKHNQDNHSPSYVNVSFEVAGDWLVFLCINSIPQRVSENKKPGGIGLVNVKRRLDLLYNDGYSLDQTKTDDYYSVRLKLKL